MAGGLTRGRGQARAANPGKVARSEMASSHRYTVSGRLTPDPFPNLHAAWVPRAICTMTMTENTVLNQQDPQPTLPTLPFTPQWHTQWPSGAWVKTHGEAHFEQAVAEEAQLIAQVEGCTVTTIRQIIADAMAQAASPVLHTPVALNSDYGPVLELLFKRREPTDIFSDIPLSAIVAVDHKNDAPLATNWEQLFSGLRATDWTPAQLDYMESEIGLQLFGPDTAHRTLDFSSYGGAVLCTNGQHRLVGAVCWLASRVNPGNPGDPRVAAPGLRKGAVSRFTLAPEVHAILAQAQRSGASVAVASIPTHGGPTTGDFKLGVWERTAHAPRIWTVTHGQVKEDAPPAGPGLARFLPTPAGHIDRVKPTPDWLDVPQALLDAILNDGWINDRRYEARVTPWNTLHATRAAASTDAPSP